MAYKVLCVDDDENILRAIQRNLRGEFAIEVAVGGAAGLEAIAKSGPFAVIVSDLRMPKMDGVEFLAKTKEVAPQTVRVMLSGNADLEAAIRVVNEGHIFRFLTKPCSPEQLTLTLRQGIEQYRLIQAEKELLEKTLTGSIKVLSEILSLVSPGAFGRAARVRRLTAKIGVMLKFDNAWQLEVAAMFSLMGCITVDDETLNKVLKGRPLSPDEKTALQNHPKVGAELIAHIPRLESVAQVIAYQDKRYDGSGHPLDSVKGKEIPLESRILKVALDFDTLTSAGMSSAQAFGQLKEHANWYDPAIIEALERALADELSQAPKQVNVADLKPGMIVADDILTTTGMLLVARGNEITSATVLRIHNFARTWGGIQEPLKVIMPLRKDTTGDKAA